MTFSLLKRRPALYTLLLSFVACGGESTTTPDGGNDAALDATQDAATDAANADAAVDSGNDASAPSDGAVGCGRPTPAADRERVVLVSHPGNSWEVLAMTADGALSRTERTLTMRSASQGVMSFTSDGAFGYVATTNEMAGRINIVAVDSARNVRVVTDGFDPGVYATSVWIDSTDDSVLWVLSAQTRNNGGGIYRMNIACDGRLSGLQRVAEANMIAGVARRDGNLLIAARDAASDTTGSADVYQLDEAGVVRSSNPAFPADNWLGSFLGLSADGRFAVVGDNDTFEGGGSRISVVDLDSPAAAGQILSDIPTPTSVAMSPFGGTFVVSTFDGNALHVFDIDAEESPAVTPRGHVDYNGARPMLPADMIVLQQGLTRGLVLVVDVNSIRRLRFDSEGDVADLGVFSLPPGEPFAIGALGVQP